MEQMMEHLLAKIAAIQKKVVSHHKDDGRNEDLAKRNEGRPKNNGGKSRGKKSVAVQEEVPKEEVAVKTVRALKKRYGDWHLATGCCLQLYKQTWGNGGSRKKLATAHRGRTQGFTRDMVIRERARTVLQKEPRKDELLERDVGHNRNATAA
jgi:hypothetical protein